MNKAPSPSAAILLAGASGRLGRELQRLLAQTGLPYLALPQSINIADQAALLAWGRAHNRAFDWIINCAAYTDTAQAETQSALCWQANASGAFNMALLAKELQAKLIHISTDYVFDGQKGSPYAESDAVSPINVYGASKACGEALITAVWPQSLILRAAWLYGEAGPNFALAIIERLKAGQAAIVTDTETGCPTWTRDLAGAILFFVRQAPQASGLYHAAAQGFCSRLGWAQAIRGLLRHLAPQLRLGEVISAAASPASAPRRPADSRLKTAKLQSLGYAFPAWKQSLQLFLKEGLAQKLF